MLTKQEKTAARGAWLFMFVMLGLAASMLTMWTYMEFIYE